MTTTDINNTPTITTTIINHDDAYRNAFQAIARRALPFMDLAGYPSDLLYDAANATELPEAGRFYLLVREGGTVFFEDAVDAIAHCSERSDGRAVLRVLRSVYDTFKVTTVYTRNAGLVLEALR